VLTARAGELSAPVIFTGACDASGVVSLSGDLFVMASDEDNILRFYRFSQPGPPLQRFDLNPLLTSKRKSPEADLEGATRLGDEVFFIGSHGRNAAGKLAPARHRLFALTLTETNGTVAVQPVGRPYTRLTEELARDPKYLRFDLDAAAKLAPKAPGGLNIEAIAATSEGTLLIGFRSPIPNGRALLAQLRNPDAVLAGKPPDFGEPILLDLGGLGLRDMTATTNGFYLLAGSVAGGGRSRLFFWAGGTAAPRAVTDVEFHKSNPEGISRLQIDGRADFLIVSDDGTRLMEGQECKTLPEAQRQFRAYRYTP